MRVTGSKRIRKAEGELGDLLGSHDRGVDLEEFARYGENPVGFVREVLDEVPWKAQREALEMLNGSDRVAWPSAQAIGKSRCIAYSALWWSYARRGQVLISAPTRRTTEEVVMRKELARLWHPNPRLGGDLYTGSLRIERDEPAILAYTATSSSAATGQHDPEGGVLAILDEAQGVQPEVWEAMDANTTGERDRQFVCGNPLDPSGSFYEVCQPGSGWTVVPTSSVFEHPNLQEDSDRTIPGGPSPAWLERMRDRWGEDSPQWTARVLGEFPESAEDALLELSWIERAFELHESGAFEEDRGGELAVAGVDVAREGTDRSCLCVRRGRLVEEFTTWRGAGTQETARRVREILERAHETNPVRRVVVDEVGVGGGVLDRLREDLELAWSEPRHRRFGTGLRRRSATLAGFKAGARARDPERFYNLASQAYWRLRSLLEAGELALPPEEELREELLALRHEVTSDSRVRVDKGRAKARLGRSPDRVDALAFTLEPELEEADSLELIWT